MYIEFVPSRQNGSGQNNISIMVMLQMSRTVFAMVCCPVQLYGGTHENNFLCIYSYTLTFGIQIVLHCVLTLLDIIV